jgi:TDG/mug DNA glycosylase family protein
MPSAPAVEARRSVILPDLLRPDLRVVFCGTAAGTASARAGAYYAGRGNRFWSILHDTNLTPRRLDPHEFEQLVEFGIGLTDVCKTRHGMDREIGTDAFDPAGLAAALAKIHAPTIAFNGKAAARAALELGSGSPLAYGPAGLQVGGAGAWVLPSTSGAASGSWDPAPWHDLAASLPSS